MSLSPKTKHLSLGLEQKNLFAIFLTSVLRLFKMFSSFLTIFNPLLVVFFIHQYYGKLISSPIVTIRFSPKLSGL